MKRRTFLQRLGLASSAFSTLSALSFISPNSARGAESLPAVANLDSRRKLPRDWRERWEKRILADSQNRYCDREMGEELGWLVSPFVDGFYYGYQATGDVQWMERMFDWLDACVRRAVKEPDEFLGWPKGNGGGGESATYDADSLLGEAMLLRSATWFARDMLRPGSPPPAGRAGVMKPLAAPSNLAEAWTAKARQYLRLSEAIFEKWESRGCWREVQDGGLWVVPDFGLDRQTKQWSAGYANRAATGFSNPDNKQNHIARWLLALYDATGKPVYRARAEQWLRLMKSRLRTREDGKFYVWNYWDPAGPWDYQANGQPKHWVGVHPNGGYYAIDVEAMVDAYEHRVVFTAEDMARLIATNRDFMWNQKVEGAQFRRIDGGAVDARWKNSPGVLWESLVPHDKTLEAIFLANHDPAGWGGLSSTPWYLALAKE